MVEGEIKAGMLYDEPDFNRSIEIRERELKRVETFMWWKLWHAILICSWSCGS